jgi:hypothetical protein
MTPATDQMITAKAATIMARKMTAAATTKPSSRTDAIMKREVTGSLLSLNPLILSTGSAPHNVDNY